MSKCTFAHITASVLTGWEVDNNVDINKRHWEKWMHIDIT